MVDGRVRRALARLEADDERERTAALPLSERSLAIAPTTGAFLFALCGRTPRCAVLEIGASRGYSTIWLGAAVRRLGGRVTSLESDPLKRELASSNIREAGLEELVEVLAGDAAETLPRLGGPFDVVFLDAWKESYEMLFALLRPLVAPGGLVVADNVLSHAETLASYSAARQRDPGLLSVTIPLDSGLELTSVLSGSSGRPS